MQGEGTHTHTQKPCQPAGIQPDAGWNPEKIRGTWNNPIFFFGGVRENPLKTHPFLRGEALVPMAKASNFLGQIRLKAQPWINREAFGVEVDKYNHKNSNVIGKGSLVGYWT